MFIEHPKEGKKGWIEVICGGMFSGKTEELIRRIKRAQIARQKTEIFKPRLDIRYHEQHIVSHDENSIPSTPVPLSSNILLLMHDAEVIGIDEAQFFDEGLPEVCTTLADNGIRVIVAGLDMDYQGKPFGPMPQLLAIADYVTKLHAICLYCGSLAHHSYRLTDNDSLIMLGEKDSYIPLCRSCFNQARRLRQTSGPTS